MSEEVIRREFNRWADARRGREMEKRHWGIARQLIELMDPGQHDNILDLGCGLGWASRVLAQRASRGVIVGIDLADRMVHEAHHAYRNPPNISFVVADAARIPCQSGFFNAVFSVESIYFYPNLDAAFQEVQRVLAPPAKAYFLINYYKENVHSHEWGKHIDLPLQLLSADDYTARLHEAGFRAVRHRRIVDSTPMPEDWTPSPWFATREDQLKFQAEGALLLAAEK